MRCLHACGICLIAERGTVFVFGKEIILTQAEICILYILMNRQGNIVSLTLLCDTLDSLRLAKVDKATNIVKRISRLRSKLFPENEKARLLFIKGIYNLGYTIPTRSQMTGS